MDDHSQVERMRLAMEKLARMGSADLEGVREDMREQDKDPEAIREEGMAFLKRLKGQLRLSAAEAERQEAMSELETLRSKARRRLEDAEEGARELIRRFMDNTGAELSVSFRKLESMDDNDILEVLTEAQLVDLLNEMDGDED
jgi:glutamyl-tRNA reductase